MRHAWVSRYGTLAHLAQFVVIGTSGLAVNLVVLTAALEMGAAHRRAIAVAIGLSMTWNFALNRRFNFSYARGEPLVGQFLGFVAACSLGAAVNYAVTDACWDLFGTKQIAAVLGVVAGTGFNFLASQFVVFRRAGRTTAGDQHAT